MFEKIKRSIWRQRIRNEIEDILSQIREKSAWSEFDKDKSKLDWFELYRNAVVFKTEHFEVCYYSTQRYNTATDTVALKGSVDRLKLDNIQSVALLKEIHHEVWDRLWSVFVYLMQYQEKKQSVKEEKEQNMLNAVLNSKKERKE